MRVEYHPQAEEELVAAAVFYGSQTASLGGEFLSEAQDAERFVAEYPFAGRGLRGVVRCFPLRRFPYDLVYALDEPILRVIAVAHQRRKPGYWRTRLNP